MNTPTPDVAAVMALADVYCEARWRMANAQLPVRRLELERAARDACYAYALAVLRQGHPAHALQPGCWLCDTIAELEALRDAQAARA